MEELVELYNLVLAEGDQGSKIFAATAGLIVAVVSLGGYFIEKYSRDAKQPTEARESNGNDLERKL